jgi:hypothetical protein
VTNVDADKDQKHRSYREQAAYRVRLPGFVREEEIGLGDVMKRATYVLGIVPCSACDRRAQALNRFLAFTR